MYVYCLKMSDIWENFTETGIPFKVMCNYCKKTFSSTRIINLKTHLNYCHETETSKNTENNSKVKIGKLENSDIFKSFTDTGIPNRVMCIYCRKTLNSTRMFNLKSHFMNSHHRTGTVVTLKKRKVITTSTIKSEMREILKNFTNTDVPGRVKCNTCDKTLNSTRMFNLKSHLKNCHRIEIVNIKRKVLKTRNNCQVIKNNKLEINELLKNFTDTGIPDKLMCNTCNKTLNSTRNSNLKSHLKNSHQMAIVCLENGVFKTQKYPLAIKTKLAINNKLEIIRSYVGLVIENGVPFDVLDSTNMRNILRPLNDALNGNNEEIFTFDADSAKRILSNVVTKFRAQLKQELKNNLFSVKIDSATRLERYILGISVQYCKDAKIISHVIGMVDLTGKHSITAKNLYLEINKTLNKYDLNIQQVVSLTSDNGANILSTTSRLSIAMAKNNEEEDDYLSNEEYEELLDEISTNTDFDVGDTTVCKCAAHNAQLVAVDVIKNEIVKDFVMKCRNVTKFLRTPSNGFRALFEENAIPLPHIDCPTRWASCYKMIIDLKSSKAIIDNSEINSRSKIFAIDEHFWDNVNQFVAIFAPLNDILIKYQEESLNYGDFYANWLKCRLLIQRSEQDPLEDSFAAILRNALIKSIEKRSQKLFSNEILKANLYLDPRFQHTLLPEEKEMAISCVKKIWDKYILVNKTYETSSTFEQFEQKTEEEDDILTAYLKQNVMENTKATNVYTKIESLKLPFLKSSANVLTYWLDRRNTDPELFILSNIIFGVPPTQVTVETAFSVLKRMLTDNRNGIGEEDLENILLAGLNRSLLDDVIAELVN